TTPWYSGVKRMIHCTAVEYCDSGKNTAENKNSGIIAMLTKSKSIHDRMYPAAARPAPANANARSTATGTASTAHHDSTSPSTTIVSRNTVEYIAPRISAHVISPTAMSRG